MRFLIPVKHWTSMGEDLLADRRLLHLGFSNVIAALSGHESANLGRLDSDVYFSYLDTDLGSICHYLRVTSQGCMVS